jgi:hypothetical protein
MTDSFSLTPQRRNGDATQIEANRAMEEIRAAVVVAQQVPRNLTVASNEMRRACSTKALADKAFYEMPRAGKLVRGESIHLARELARCYGNFRYGLTDLNRNDPEGYSEIMAWAWDVQGNVWVQRTFRVRHLGGKGGNQVLKTEQDIYTNNSNAGARRLRECIFAGLSVWFRDEAAELCRQTITPAVDALPVSIDAIVADFARGNVDVPTLERKVKRARRDWTPQDVADLRVLFGSLTRREVTRDEAFPAEGVTAKEILADAQADGGDDWPETPQPPADEERS